MTNNKRFHKASLPLFRRDFIVDNNLSYAKVAKHLQNSDSNPAYTNLFLRVLSICKHHRLQKSLFNYVIASIPPHY
jgi:hypothetical protein